MPTPPLGGGSGDSIADIEAIGRDEVWFVGHDQPQPIAPQPALIYRWNGSEFERFFVDVVNTEIGRNSGNPLGAIDAFSSDDIWAVGGTDINADGAPDHSQIHRWDGTRWNHVPGPTPGMWNSLTAVEAVAADDVWAAGQYFSIDEGYVSFLIRWNGSEWVQHSAPGFIRDFSAFAADDIYAFGDAIYHFDGADWSLVADFPGVDRPVLAGGDAAGACELFAVGQQDVGDAILNFSVRAAPSGPDADLNNDGSVNAFDLFELINQLGPCPAADCPADLDGDGVVNFFDIMMLIDALG